MWKKVDPNLLFLALVMAVFSAVLVITTYLFPNDGQVFQVFAGVLTGTMAIFGRGASKTLGLPADDSSESGTVGSNGTATPATTVMPAQGEKDQVIKP